MTVAELIDVLQSLPKHAVVHKSYRWSDDILRVTHEIGQFDCEVIRIYGDGRTSAMLEEKIPFG